MNPDREKYSVNLNIDRYRDRVERTERETGCDAKGDQGVQTMYVHREGMMLPPSNSENLCPIFSPECVRLQQIEATLDVIKTCERMAGVGGVN